MVHRSRVLSLSTVALSTVALSMVVTCLPLMAFGQHPPTIDPTYGMRPPKPRAVRALPPDAKWIWADSTSDNQTVLLRRSFTLATVPKSAKIYITADNEFSLSMNGKAVPVDQPADPDAWSQVRSVDVTNLLLRGSNVIAVQAHNDSGAAGLLVRIEADGKPVLFTDGSWKTFPVSETQSAATGWQDPGFDDGAWTPATVIAPVGGGPWTDRLSVWPVPFSSEVGYLAHLPILPVRVGTYTGLGDIKWSDWNASEDFTPSVDASDGKPWHILIDFGKELSGRVEIKRSASDSYPIALGTGESEGEAIEKPWTSVTGSSPVTASQYTSLRFASLEIPASIKRAHLNIKLDHLYYPVTYRGSFECSDALLNKIWYTGAYTAHLCMQQDIWDAPKRDRARWMGDLHVSGEVINNVFADRFLMEQTMTRLREDAQQGHPASDLPGQNVNGIPGYSCAWICGLADFYRHVGDRAYLVANHAALVTMLDYLKGELDDNGLFANRHGQWPFVDWSPDYDKDGPAARATTHLFLDRAVREAIFLLTELEDKPNAEKMTIWEHELWDVAQKNLQVGDGTFGDRLEENAMAVYSGVATGDERSHIYPKVFATGSAAWDQEVSPYYGNYVLQAMSECGHTDDALGWMRKYWGGMIAEGATSFWEAYDPKWDKDNFHIHLNADDGTGYFVSLCHGWSAGPTSFLTERVLGIRSTGAGFATCDVEPNLAGLTWAQGVVPTPHGDVRARVELGPDQTKLTLHVPKGVTANVILPGNLSVDGVQKGSGSVSLTAGQHVIVSIVPAAH